MSSSHSNGKAADISDGVVWSSQHGGRRAYVRVVPAEQKVRSLAALSSSTRPTDIECAATDVRRARVVWAASATEAAAAALTLANPGSVDVAHRLPPTLPVLLKSYKPPSKANHPALHLYELSLFRYAASKWHDHVLQWRPAPLVGADPVAEQQDLRMHEWHHGSEGIGGLVAQRVAPNGVFGPLALVSASGEGWSAMLPLDLPTDPHPSVKVSQASISDRTAMMRDGDDGDQELQVVHPVTGETVSLPRRNLSDGQISSPQHTNQLHLHLSGPTEVSGRSTIAECKSTIATGTSPTLDCILYPDIGGQLLSELARSWSPECLPSGVHRSRIPSLLIQSSILACAVSLTDALRRLHELGIINKSIRPDTVLYNAATNQCQFIDMSQASLLDRETSGWARNGVLDVPPEHWNYMSPEQTGRVPRLVDLRTDLWSIGMTLFTLVTGAPAFPFSDVMDCIHGILASEVRFLTDAEQSADATNGTIAPGNPVVWMHFRAVVHKLLSKSVEDRYQSASGLHADLLHLQRQLDGVGDRDPSFALGSVDRHGHFVISQRLVGREAQVRQLLDAYQHLLPPRSHGPQLFLVGGFSGIGKTSLVDYVQQPLVLARGRFCRAKFDLYRRNSAVIFDAFSGLLTQILTEDVRAWGERILAAIGGTTHAYLLIDVMPPLEKIIGKAAAPAAALQPTEATLLFNRLFVAFVSVFALPESPLIVFVDDTQWADQMSLHLIRHLFNQKHLCLMVISAYRSNEVSPQHPLMELLHDVTETDQAERMQAQSDARGTRVNHLLLEPLELGSCAELLSGTLHCPSERVQSLAEVLHRQTGGSPFFFVLLLSAYHKHGWLKFDWQRCEWMWDLAAVRMDRIGSLDNVVALLQQQVQQLPRSQQQLLLSAACIGNRFSLDTLATISECTPQHMARSIWPLIMSGLIVPLGSAAEVFSLANVDASQPSGIAVEFDGASRTEPAAADNLAENALTAVGLLASQEIGFRFLHDSVQQASYQLMSPTERPQRHITIARLLYRNTASEGKSALALAAMDLVEQFNAASSLIVNTEEVQQVIELNLMACSRAKSSTAFGRCNYYCKQANVLLERLDANATVVDQGAATSTHAFLRFTVVRALIDSYYLINDFTNAEREALNMALDAEKVAILKPEFVSQQVEANELLCTIYAAQNSRLADCVEAAQTCLRLLNLPLIKAGSEAALTLAQRDVYDLTQMEDAVDPAHLLRMRLCNAILAVSWITGRLELLGDVIRTMLAHAFEYGASLYAAGALIFYAGSMQPSDYTLLEVELRIQALKVRVADSGYRLLERFAYAPQTSGATRGKNSVGLYAVASPWYTPIREVCVKMKAAWADCLESGEYEYGAYAVALGGAYRYIGGHSLLQIESYLLDSVSDATAGRRPNEVAMAHQTLQMVQKLLLRRTHDQPFAVNGVPTNESRMAQELLDSNINIWGHVMTSYHQQWLYWTKDFAGSAALVPQLQRLRRQISNHPTVIGDWLMGAMVQMASIDVPQECINRAQRAALRSITFDEALDCERSVISTRMFDAGSAVTMESALRRLDTIRADVLRCHQALHLLGVTMSSQLRTLCFSIRGGMGASLLLLGSSVAPGSTCRCAIPFGNRASYRSSTADECRYGHGGAGAMVHMASALARSMGIIAGCVCSLSAMAMSAASAAIATRIQSERAFACTTRCRNARYIPPAHRGAVASASG